MTVQEHSGNDKSCVWHASDFADGELKDELFCIRFASIESEYTQLSVPFISGSYGISLEYYSFIGPFFLGICQDMVILAGYPMKMCVLCRYTVSLWALR